MTLHEAADLAHVSYGTTASPAGEVPSERDAAGVITLARRDVALIERRPEGDDDRHAVMPRPKEERYAA